MSPEVAQQFESTFLAPVDSGAARSMQLMLQHKDGEKLTKPYRQAWTRFLLSLLFRMPADIKTLKANIRDDWIMSIPDMQDKYTEARRESDPLSLAEFLDGQDDSVYEESAMGIAKKMIAHANISGTIRNMYWSIVSLEGTDFSLLTSDRPVIITEQLNLPESHILLPIGPHHLFVAVHSRRHSTFLRSRTKTQLARLVNLTVVESATEVVYGHNDKQERFVAHRLGTNRPPSQLERVQMLRKEQMQRLPNTDSVLRI
ncbi:DUF4238 domain-containing protein [Mesorhizobium sp. M0598]|uniref:DUF4238 domain-containing protein n=1 Tax=Mesorhizobium sp. M0598 TaxID=2956968 RepID=UPI00333D9269